MAAGSSFAVPPPLPPSPNYTGEQAKPLLRLSDSIDFFIEAAESVGIDPQKALTIRLSVDDGFSFLEKVLNEGQVADAASSLVSNPHHPNESPVESNAELSSSIDEAETMEMRYLYVSNGHEIYLLDLKKPNEKPLSNAASDHVPPLPIIATLNLIEKGLPVFVSLFKLGSDAYIIGGQEYSADMILHGYDFSGYNGTSHESFRLSFNPDRKDSLSHSNGIIKPMKLPKISPIVEEIDGVIHVFDSNLQGRYPSSDWIFSHEVLHLLYDRPSDNILWKWRKIRSYGSPVDDFMQSHLVVGPCIYALCGQKALLFNSKKKNKWEVLKYNIHECPLNKYTLHTVCDILSLGGAARCILEIGEEVDSRMYVIISLVTRGYGGCFPRDSTTIADAYLVSSSGNVVGRQPLPHFFKGPMLQPISMTYGEVIRADVEGKTVMCSLVKASDEAIPDHYLFINTFTVEKITSFDYSKYAFETAKIPPVPAEFVRVDIKGRYIYKTEERLSNNVQACFM